MSTWLISAHHAQLFLHVFQHGSLCLQVKEVTHCVISLAQEQIDIFIKN